MKEITTEPTKEKIMVFIPMYNCEKQIVRVISQFDQELQMLFDEIIIIDNISEDQSIIKAQQTLERQIKNCKASIFKNKNNYSLGGSIKIAFEYAILNNYDYMITLHGDAQGNIRDAIPIIKIGKHRTADICIGARFHRNSKLEGYSRFRTLGNKIFNSLCSVITLKKIDDLIAGLNIYNVNFLKELYPTCLHFPNDLTFDVHCLLYAIKNKKKFIYFPLTWKEEDQVSNAKIFRQAFIILKLFTQFLFKRKTLFKISAESRSNSLLNDAYESELVYHNS